MRSRALAGVVLQEVAGVEDLLHLVVTLVGGDAGGLARHRPANVKLRRS